MSVRAKSNINHNGSKYCCGDIIFDITKEEANRLVSLDVAEIIDDKFKTSKKKIEQNIKLYKRNKKLKEEQEYSV
ncbi:hypothetical protein [Hathewaya massiliensis]|uniref:hypothetical protein n=1 Tax=Hathewaya massiliensis TaxID=1964382 RepID=UPI0011594ACF|nr:hypothetical protein [Hathewaya massiliensis]